MAIFFILSCNVLIILFVYKLMSDLNKLIQGCLKKQQKAIGDLYKMYSPLIYGICLRYTKNVDDANDLLQDCFIKIIDRIGDYRFEGSFEGWIRRLTIHESINFIRRGKIIEFEEITDVSSEIPDECSDVVSKMSAEEILKYINKLSDGYRTIFNMAVIEGFKHAEISEMLGITESTSRSQLKRAREILINMILKDC